MKTFRFVLLLFLVLSISNTAWAQNQTVKGRVMDSKLKEPLMEYRGKFINRLIIRFSWSPKIGICLYLHT